MLNVWDPQHVSVGMGLLTAFLLGLIHGITPDEHTWPITFSYAIGSRSTQGGMKAGFLFALAFTFQRAIASQLAFFALVGFLFHPSAENIVYGVVGIVMAISGYYIRFRHKTIHLFPWLEKWMPNRPDSNEPIPIKMPLIHGVIAGCGTGAFATIIYTVIAPAMPSAWFGFVPGLVFGIGTVFMQTLIGALFGWWMEKYQVSAKAKAYIGTTVAGNTLLYGGVMFVLVGLLGLFLPGISDWSIATGIKVHNLDSINTGLLLSVFVVAGVGGISLWRAMRYIRFHSKQEMDLENSLMP
ncbi:hypothetical protein LSG31_19330 [Fodinisporobacter ferrooxydans]|uniref:Urease accessory protein UreH-like transmembrane domain-containing protein n=1 Tax=Fodinisporobacter ferrooxydans TaxID=2901836 RepID=A0ABY4CHL0_9BACL|nr:hypothetical protein LSG31_19330 [Alicyclobacillaceae bacterium MYW30-H2]